MADTPHTTKRVRVLKIFAVEDFVTCDGRTFRTPEALWDHLMDVAEKVIIPYREHTWKNHPEVDEFIKTHGRFKHPTPGTAEARQGKAKAKSVPVVALSDF